MLILTGTCVQIKMGRGNKQTNKNNCTIPVNKSIFADLKQS